MWYRQKESITVVIAGEPKNVCNECHVFKLTICNIVTLLISDYSVLCSVFVSWAGSIRPIVSGKKKKVLLEYRKKPRWLLLFFVLRLSIPSLFSWGAIFSTKQEAETMEKCHEKVAMF